MESSNSSASDEQELHNYADYRPSTPLTPLKPRSPLPSTSSSSTPRSSPVKLKERQRSKTLSLSSSSCASPGPDLFTALPTYEEKKDDDVPAHVRAFAENVMQKLNLLPPDRYHATCKKLDDLLYKELMKEAPESNSD